MSTEVVTADISCMFYLSFYLFFYLVSDSVYFPLSFPPSLLWPRPPKQRLSAQVLSALANQNPAFRPPPQASTKLGSYHVSGH